MACDIELEIGAGSSPGEFMTRVVDAPSGGQPSTIVSLDVDGLLRDRDTLETTVLASAVSGRKIISGHEQQLRQMGRLLFDALFSGPVNSTYRASLGVAQQRGEPLRVVLRLTAPQLAALPWEALFDPETETYICRKESLVRRVPVPYASEPLKVTPPLRVLGLVASPRGMPLLDVSAEQDHLSEALAAPIAEALIHLEWVAQASWEAVQEKLLSAPWHVLHFIGHGDYDATTDQGVIALVDENNRPNLVEAEQLADLLNEARPTPRLVVLNSCSSGEQGIQDLFSGTAATLVRSGISAVAAMQFTVSDRAAIAFATGFYTAIANGRSVDDATRSGRIAIRSMPHTLEWVTPVLYVRGESTQLFDVTERPPGPAASPFPAAPGNTVIDETPPLSDKQQRQIPQEEQPTREASRSKKRRLLVAILAGTGVLAVTGVLLAVFLPGSSPTYTVAATVLVGQTPAGVAVDPSSHAVYVANTDGGTVSVINGSSHSVVDTVYNVGPQPGGVAVDPGSGTVYVGNQGNGTVSVIDGSRHTVTTTVHVGQNPEAAAVDPDTHTVYVPNHDGSPNREGGTVSVIDGPRHTVIDTVDVGKSPLGVAVDVDQGTHTVYVANTDGGTVSVMDGLTHKVTAPAVDVGMRPVGVAVDSRTHTVYVGNWEDGTVSVIDGSTRRVIAPAVDVGQNPVGVAVDSRTHTVYVANGGGGTVSVIDGSTRKVIATVDVGKRPVGVAVDPGTHTVYVANADNGTVSVIESR